MTMASFTLARKVDPRYKTNLTILIMTITLLIARGLFTGEMGGSLVFAGGFFLTWALAREIDPLHDQSAFVAAAVYLAMTMWIVELNLGLVFWTILLLRSITKIAGRKPTVIDLLGLIGLGIYVIINMSIRLPGEPLAGDGFRILLLILGSGAGIFYGRMLKGDRGIRDDLGNPVESQTIVLSYTVFLGMYVVLFIATDLGEGTLSLFFAVIMGTALHRGWMMISGSITNRRSSGR